MKLHILQAVNNYAKKSPVRLHMPAHKGDKNFIALFGGAEIDITELKSADNERAVVLAEQDIKDILGAKSVTIASDGASMAVFALVYAVKSLGNKMIINRTAHKCVYNALVNFGIEPIIVGGIAEDGLPEVITSSELDKVLTDNPSAIGALFTYPDYYGRTFDIASVKAVLEKHGKKLLIDNAHGGHYAFIDGYRYAGLYADAWVDSAHKVLCTLNQGAIIAVNDQMLVDGVKQGAGIFSTSSPSYPILASVEYGVKKADAERQENTLFCKSVENLKEEISSFGFDVIKDTDCFKLAVDFGGNVDAVEKYFEDNGFYAEMNDGRRLLFMFSFQTTADEILRLKETFKKLTVQKADVLSRKYILGERKTDYITATSSKWEYTRLEDAVGKVSAVNAGTFPPCFPLVLAGESITQDVVNTLMHAHAVFGVVDGNIKTLK